MRLDTDNQQHTHDPKDAMAEVFITLLIVLLIVWMVTRVLQFLFPELQL